MRRKNQTFNNVSLSTKSDCTDINTSTSNTTTNSNSDTPTPIEVVLQIDENGMTTASKLYEFLQLDISNFARWCKKNIVNNKFSTENVDYVSFVQHDEKSISQGIKAANRPKTDYRLTSDFAKKLSMTGNSDRHEQARQYFLACEQGYTIATKKLTSQSHTINKNVINILSSLTDRLENLEIKLNVLNTPHAQTESTLDKRYPSTWYKRIAPKYKLLQEYFNCTRSELYRSIYTELEDTYNINIEQIFDNYCYENHLSKNSTYPMDAIEHNIKIRDAITLLIDSSLVKYRLQTEDEIRSYKRNTLFDRVY